MKNEYILKKNPEMLTRKIGSETLLIPIYKTTGSKSYLYSLNDDASDLWKIIDGKNSMKDLKKRIALKYNLNKSGMRKINICISDLKKIKALI